MTTIHRKAQPMTDTPLTRAARTIGQGVVTALLLAGVPILLDVMSSTDRLSDVDWGDAADRAGYAMIVALLMAGLAWAMKRREA